MNVHSWLGFEPHVEFDWRALEDDYLVKSRMSYQSSIDMSMKFVAGGDRFPFVGRLEL